jgi:hypothetical protein
MGAILSTGGRTDRIEPFIARWQGREGGQERANYGLFLTELCETLELPRPDPADANPETNDYVFERVVKEPARSGEISSRRIDLYKRGCFVLEAKQSRWKGGDKDKEVAGQTDLFTAEVTPRGRRGAERSWDVLMLNARQQAENYVRLLPAAHEPPPFVIVCDVGHCFEVYANFRRDGKAYDQFPDRQSFRIYLEDLRDAKVRERLTQIWSEPLLLDPARESARVTRAIAVRLAAVSKALEAKKLPPEDVAAFLMRCLFTMFAEDVGLLPEASFRNVLERCERDTSKFQPMVGQLWEAMDKGEFAYAIEAKVRQFNGEFFKSRNVLPLGREEIGELRQAASHNWRDVDPSIFGTLLEQALDPNERRRLGAHYTPRAYVERLVVATIIEPLREDWTQVLTTAERQKSEGRAKDAAASVAAFHDKLCKTRILDPACGTGNFLYVSLELLKRLEGEVLEALTGLGGQEALSGLEGHTIDPHQFLGMELNPRAAAIAELVLWIGHLQWHLRTKGGMPSEPILKAFKNIVVKNAVLEADITSRPGESIPAYKNPRLPEWSPAEFIVGNPPFVAGQNLRQEFGDAYAEALWTAYPHVPGGADLVMLWWDRAAELLTESGTVLRRFGFVTTNSITQEFSGRVVARHLRAKSPIFLTMAIPNHPWTKATKGAAAVRIAMTVAERGEGDGILRETLTEEGLDTDEPRIAFTETHGRINPNLTVGIDVTSASKLLANEGICHDGVKLHGKGFIVRPVEAEHLGLGRRVGAERVIRPYLNGRDINQRSRNVLVIDLFGMSADEVRRRFPEIYQHVLATVKPGRDQNRRASRKSNWWLFGENQPKMRGAINGLGHFIATVDTSRHRIFQFLEENAICDDKVVICASADSFLLGTMSSRIHCTWAIHAGVRLGVGNDPVYASTRCFDPFPFPAATDAQKERIRAIAEELDAHRKQVLAEHPHLTLTGLYNVLEEFRVNAALGPDDRRIFADGLVLILKELHDKLDAAVADAYGWPIDLTDREILSRLVALNKERTREEAQGVVRWLRPDYQIPRFGSVKEKAELDLVGGKLGTETALPSGPKPLFPTDDLGQNIAVTTVLAGASGPLDANSLATAFKQGRRIAPKVASILAALSRMGFVTTGDGGRTFLLRRAA